MTRLILTVDSSSAGGVVSAGHADLAVAIELRMAWGPPQPDAELAAFLTTRTRQAPGLHWLDSVPPLLPRTDATRVVRSAGKGPQRSAAASAMRSGNARKSYPGAQPDLARLNCEFWS